MLIETLHTAVGNLYDMLAFTHCDVAVHAALLRVLTLQVCKPCMAATCNHPQSRPSRVPLSMRACTAMLSAAHSVNSKCAQSTGISSGSLRCRLAVE